MGVMIIAIIGLLVNVISAWQLSHDHDNLNSRAALIHVLGDLLGSVAAIAAGAVIYFTGWMPIDPILSIAVSLLILRSTWSLLRQSTHLLMEGVPDGIDLNQVGAQLAAVKGIVEVHDLHVWSIGSKRKALSAHLIISDPLVWPSLILQLNQMLETQYGIDHVTLQPAWLSEHDGKIVPIHRIEH
ncbi:MAG: cation diffusion facilitator family transporter, partial [Deefgea sp.]